MARQGTHFVYEKLEWWAENGLIYLEDHRDDTFNAFTVRDALEKAAALTVERRRMDRRIKLLAAKGASTARTAAQEREKLQTAIEGLVTACEQAKKQGDPTDPRVIEDLRKQRKKHILMPGAGLSVMDTPRPAQIILGRA